MNFRRIVATSNSAPARIARKAYRGFYNFSIPAPRAVFRPILTLVLGIRELWYLFARVFICEPLFKAYCTRFGKNLHTGVFLHWVIGTGDLILGDNVTVDGKCSFVFGTRFAERATLVIGNGTGIGHNCSFVVAKRIDIGEDCRFAPNVHVFDSPGHPLDPEDRRAGLPPRDADVKPVRIGNNVWIGAGAVIYPGVTIGDDSVIGAHAVVTTDVPPRVLMSGNPARKVLVIPPSSSEPAG